MKQAREICEKNNYSHLVIPTARIHENFIIESRLPLLKHDWKAQIGFYLDHIEELTKAVEEFTGFLCQASLGDITVEGKQSDYSTLSKVPVGRYDNVPMYLENGIGKLGLIDLEVFYPEHLSEDCFRSCQEAIRLFPHHLETIIHAAKKFDSNIEKSRKELEEERDCVLEYFNKVYQVHLDFIKEKKIDITDPAKFADISELRKEMIREAVVKYMLQDSECRALRETSDLDLAIKTFNEKGFSKIFNMTLNFISFHLKFNIESLGGKEKIFSYPELLSARTLMFHPGSSIYPLSDLQKNIGKKLRMFTWKNKCERFDFARLLVRAILNELVNSKEIAYNNPRFGRAEEIHCIFC